MAAPDPALPQRFPDLAKSGDTSASYELNLEEYWQIILRRRAIILFCAFALGGFSWLFTWMNQPPPLYSSTSSVKIEKSTDMTGLLMQSMSMGTGDDMSTQIAMVKSYALLERVAKRLGWLPQELTGKEIRSNPVYMGKVLELKGDVEAEQEGDSGIINITSTSSTPEFARDLAQTMAEEFSALNVEEKNRRVFDTKHFVEHQLVVVGDRLKKSEEAVRAFGEKNNLATLGQKTEARVRLVTQQEEAYRQLAAKLNAFRFSLERIKAGMARGPWDYKAVTVESRVSPYFDLLNRKLVEMALHHTELSTRFTDEHPAMQDLREQAHGILKSMVEELEQQVRLIETRMSELQKNLEHSQEQYLGVPKTTVEMRRLKREVAMNEQLFGILEQKFQEVQIKAAEKVQEVTILRPALISRGRINPVRTTQTAMAGFILGLVLGLIIALIMESMDSSAGTIEEVESFLEVPVIGFVPNLAEDEAAVLFSGTKGLATSGSDLERQIRLVTHFSPPSTIAEAYRSMRTNLMFAQSGTYQVILVTSSTMKEGKSSVASNLAVVIAQQGARVLLIDGDMRKPMQHKTFGMHRAPGLSEYLLGQCSWQDAVRRISDVLLGDFGVDQVLMTPGLDQLDILTCGLPAAHPTDLLAAPAMDQLLKEARLEYDQVILDMPPLLHTTDASVIAVKVDGILLVYHVGSVVRSVLKRVKSGVEGVGGKVIGVVLNGIRGDMSPDFAKYKMDHSYAYSYGEHGHKDESWLDVRKRRIKRVFHDARKQVLDRVNALRGREED